MVHNAPKTPLEVLVLDRPAEQVRDFLLSSTEIRGLLEQGNNSIVALPLRGVMPTFWAADGFTELEPSSLDGSQALELPIGTYQYDDHGSMRYRGSSYRSKRDIIFEQLDAALASGESNPNLTLMDEVQSGGTIVQLAKLTMHYAQNYGVRVPLDIIAVQDSAPRAKNRQKLGTYLRMVGNVYPGFSSTVVPTPLIACDRANLLDTITFTGSGHLTNNPVHEFQVTRNEKSETLFRKLGTMMRQADVASDDGFVRELVDEQDMTRLEAANRIEDWLAAVIRPGVLV